MKTKNKQGWVIVDGVHCCYCQLAEYACPNHEDTKKAYRKLFNQPKHNVVKEKN